MRAWLDAYAECKGVPQASKAVGIDRGTPHKARKVDPDFAAAWDTIDTQITGELEKAAICRAIEGYDEITMERDENSGELVETKRVRKFSNALAIFLLKCRKPSVYNIAPGQLGNETSTQDRARELRETLALMEKSVGNQAAAEDDHASSE